MYDFESGDLSLDFANTMNWHGSKKPVEELTSYADLVTWGEKARLISKETAERLKEQELQAPDAANNAYVNAIQLREAIYRIFNHLYADKPIANDDMALLNEAVCEAMAHLQLAPHVSKCEWEWAPGIDDINLILWPVARSAAQLLTSDNAARVHECEDDRGCGYLFIDQTKNNSRRWCSMESCGNRAKAKRHYSRIQAG
jgi:predicted RNA-binding Zn ribbon-like protein